jgi:hypothetical protein
MTTEDAVKETDEILDYMRVYKGNEKNEELKWNVFQIGSVSSPLNFASQQQRAFKLTYALDKKELIKGRKIAVVGGGLAGLTAGIVCLLRGAEDLTLYEKTHELMAFQHGAIHRYVHPMIFKWPNFDADVEETDNFFPILNWKADNADKIRRGILFEIDELMNDCFFSRSKPDKKFYKHRLGADVRHLVFQESNNKVKLIAEAQDSIQVKARKKGLNLLEGGGEFLPVGIARNYQNEYDVVIIAVGYGIEKKHSLVPFRSYWHLDTLAQPTIRGSWPRRWLVSGTGDGGLIDAIRLVLFDFDQENITTILLGKEKNDPKFDKHLKQWIDEGRYFNYDWYKQLKDFRQDLINGHSSLKIDDQKEQKDFQDQLERIINESKRSNYYYKRHQDYVNFTNKKLTHEDLNSEKIEHLFRMLLEKYPKVNFVLKNFLQRFRRTDTIVYLNGTTKQPYQLSASLFNCFLIYLLRRDCGLRYRCGELEIPDNLNKSNTYRVLFKRKDRHDEPSLEIDDIVIRHGAEPTFGILFGTPTHSEAVNKFNCAEFDKKLWDDDSIFKKWCDDLKKYVDSLKKLDD